jgi:hypothetical protein
MMGIWYIGTITGDFINNTSEGSGSSMGGAIYNYYGATIDNLNGNFINNSAKSNSYAYGGAIYNEKGIIKNLSGDFVGNSANGTYYAEGGAIDNYGGIIGSTDENGNVVGGLINSSLLNNYAKSDEGSAYGGAIYTNTNLNLIADNKTVEISGNYTDSAGVIDDNAMYIDGATLTFKLDNSAKILMKDNVRGADYGVNIVGDNIDDTTFYMFNDMYDANLSIANTTINTIDNKTHVYNVNSLTLNDNVKMVADVDLANEEMDRFTANSYGEHKGTISVTGMNLLSDMPDDKDMTSIMFAQGGLKNNVVDYLSSVPDGAYQNFEYYTPIYKYYVAYDNRDDAGYYVFTRGDKYYTGSGSGSGGGSLVSTGNPSDAFNPAVLTTPVSTQASAQMILSQAYIHSFRHVDAYTLIPNSDRMAELNKNKYAFASTDFDNNISYDAAELLNKGIWFKPYTSFDTMSLRHGPRVHSVNYGSLVGFDTDYKQLKHGWIAVGTGFLGYNGSQLTYSHTDVSTNGGLLGYTGSFYKGNFWTAVSISAGASVGESHNMYGRDNFTTLMAGLASKTGYNFEFKEGKFIFQPSLIMAYSLIHTFDYTNAAGVKIDSDPMHSLQLNPNLKFIVNMKNCFHPYATVGMVWNVYSESHVKANGVTLPDMSVKPYLEYGVGVLKHWTDKFSAFGQVTLRAGGRRGVALYGGFRWAIGRDRTPIQKVQTKPITKRTVATRDYGVDKKVSKIGMLNQGEINTSNHGERKVIKSLDADRLMKVRISYN